MSWVSLSAAPQYINVVKGALENDNIFKVFKSLMPFYRVVGTSEHAHAVECYDNLCLNKNVRQNLDRFAINDSIGTPLLKLGYYGTDTLRFAESVSLMDTIIGDLNGKTIFEFGSNYGGLFVCLIQQYPEIKAYYMKDIPIVEQLSVKYMGALRMDLSKVNFDEPTEPADLAISELALTEFTDDDLYFFYEKYFQPAKNIFLRSNISDPKRDRKFFERIKADFDKVLVIDEPAIRLPNKIIIAKR
jgi:hypothetical protein